MTPVRPPAETRPKAVKWPANKPGILNAALLAEARAELGRASPYFSLPFTERVKQALAA